MLLYPVLVLELCPVDKRELGVHVFDPILERLDGFLRLLDEGRKVRFRDVLYGFVRQCKSNLTQCVDVPDTISGHCLQEEVPLTVPVLRMEIRMQGFRDEPVESTKFLGLFLAIRRGVEIIIGSLYIRFSLLDLNLELLLLKLDPRSYLSLIRAFAPVDVRLDEMRLQDS